MKADLDIFRKVAARELEPDAGATIVMQRRADAKARRRPAWMPKWLFSGASVLFIFVLGLFGIRPTH